MFLFERCVVIHLVHNLVYRIYIGCCYELLLFIPPLHTQLLLRYILVFSQLYLMAVSFLTKILYASFMFSMCATYPTHLYLIVLTV